MERYIVYVWDGNMWGISRKTNHRRNAINTMMALADKHRVYLLDDLAGIEYYPSDF